MNKRNGEKSGVEQPLIEYGRSIRWYNNYVEEVNFSKENSFDFMQVWYKQGEILLDNIENSKEKTIEEIGFPIIFHALLDINEFEEKRMSKVLCKWK